MKEVINRQPNELLKESPYSKDQTENVPRVTNSYTRGAELSLNVTAARKAAYPLNWTGPSKNMYQTEQWLQPGHEEPKSDDTDSQRSTFLVAEQSPSNSGTPRSRSNSGSPRLRSSSWTPNSREGSVTNQSDISCTIERSPSSSDRVRHRLEPSTSQSTDVTEVGWSIDVLHVLVIGVFTYTLTYKGTLTCLYPSYLQSSLVTLMFLLSLLRLLLPCSFL